MGTKRLVFAALALAILGGVIWWSNRQEATKKDEPDPKAPPKVLTIAEGDLRKIEIRHKGEADVTTLERPDNGKWRITMPLALNADQGSVAAMTSAASNLDSQRLVSENNTDLASYGLEPPQIAVTFTLADGSTKVLRIGDSTPDNSATFATVDGDPRLFTIASFSKEAFNKHAADLRDKNLITFDQDKLTHVEVAVAGKAPFEFARDGEQWHIDKPAVMRADNLQVTTLLGALRDARIEPAPQTDPAKTPTAAEVAAKENAAFNSAKPVATATITGGEGKQTLEVRKSGDDYYARSSTVSGAYRVNAAIGEALNKSLDDFRNKRLFDFGFDDVSRIDYTADGKTESFTKSGDNWTSNGKTMDSLSVQNLIDKLRELSATSFSTAKPGATSVEITVVSKAPSSNAEHTEKVNITAGPAPVATRPNDASVYVLEPVKAAEIRAAAAGVREPSPTAAPAKAK